MGDGSSRPLITHRGLRTTNLQFLASKLAGKSVVKEL